MQLEFCRKGLHRMTDEAGAGCPDRIGESMLISNVEWDAARKDAVLQALAIVGALFEYVSAPETPHDLEQMWGLTWLAHVTRYLRKEAEMLIPTKPTMLFDDRKTRLIMVDLVKIGGDASMRVSLFGGDNEKLSRVMAYACRSATIKDPDTYNMEFPIRK